jgi:antitoxin VapB
MPKKRNSKHSKISAALVGKPTGASGPGSTVWREFFDFVRGIDIPEDWMKDRPMNRIPTVDRTLFSEED